jgi:hypothetical protein
MKKVNTSFKNENLVATIVIATVFIVTGLITLYFYVNS